MGTNGIAGPSPRAVARVAGLLYLTNIVTSLIAFAGMGSHALISASGWAATAAYVGVTILLYFLFKPVSRSLSLIAALFSLAGCLVGLRLFPCPLDPLVFFGCYCVLVGYMILRSIFMPRAIGVLMILVGMGWLTFLWPPLARALSPYHYIAGGIGEGLLTLWLLVMGVNAERWKQQAKVNDLAQA